MTLQEILFIISIVFFALAALFVITAVVVFFVRNIPDVQADLSGKKRAEAVAKIASERPGRDRRKGVARVEPTSGQLAPESQESSPLDNPLNQVPHVSSVVQDPSGSAASTQQPSAGSAQQPPTGSVQQSPASSAQQSSAALDSRQSPKSEPSHQRDSFGKGAPSDDSTTTILPDDTQSTIILHDDDSATTILSAEEASEAPAGFVVVRKVILQENTDFITAD